MGLKSLQLVLFSVFRGIIGVSLIVLGFGVVGAVTSYTIALILTGMIGFILFLKFIKFEGGSPGYFSVKSLKILIKFGLPISLSAIVGGTLTQLYSYFLALFVTTDLIGNYGASLNFGVVITFFTVPIQSSLLPLFSKFKRDDPRLQTVFRLAVKYTAMITLPLAVLIIALSQPISHLVYGASYTYVPLFLSLYLLSYVFEGLGGITLSNMILGLGETKVVFYTSLIILIVGAPLAQILISRYQVVGLLITMIVAPRFGWLYQTLWTKKHLNITIGVKGIYRVYLSTLTAFALTYALIYFTNLGNLGTILLGSLIFGAIYVLCLFYTGAVKKQDLEQIGETTESLGPASSIIRKVLPILLKFAKE
jgi:PST family polysaccharide transporter